MLTGLLQQKNLKMLRAGSLLQVYRFPLSPVSSSRDWRYVSHQDVSLKTFCAVRATLQLEDFNVEGLTRVLHAGNLLCAGVFTMRAGLRSPLMKLCTIYPSIHTPMSSSQPAAATVLSIYLSIHPSIHLYLSISIYMYLYLSIWIYLYLSIGIYLYLSISISMHFLSFSLSIYLI